jgi:lipopolysaccharide/colanic/teichoic acid biosynthesis glycosyltransferase
MSTEMNYFDRGESPHRAAGITPMPQGPTWYASCKRAVDAVLAVLLLILASPLMLVAMILMRLTSRGPAIYPQRRVGRDGRCFTMYKIRTMVHHCERSTGPVWAISRDSRATAIGRLLRRTHFDELPQLWNIVRGEMSLVGPRPERPEIIAQLERAIPHYRYRLSVTPGLTGLAQVQLPPDTDLAGVQRKLVFDLYYIQRLSFWLDLQLLLCTALFLVGIPFAVSRRLLRVPSRGAAEDAYQDLSRCGLPKRSSQLTWN